MGDVVALKPETYAYACECGCAEMICFTDGDIMCNECGTILDIEIIPKRQAVLDEPE